MEAFTPSLTALSLPLESRCDNLIGRLRDPEQIARLQENLLRRIT
jgi:hypothetical protein